MRLKSLEIKGFKSFADQTVIHFSEDIVGIVGPNGSGKSNVVDAIRWVLGEQKSKELRLEQMSSVIFNGTKNRKPGGLAQVTLTFENTKNILPTEYQTVSITRMLYRTGESEYRLNNVPCRLKDITSLFLDTGIGSNSYSIIALGMVDDILYDKDNARRRMFEQAAGISKYKARKQETISKLKSTAEDLERIQDLLFEINSQMGTLEKQAKRTRRYFELKDKYKQHSIELALIKTDSLKLKFTDFKSKLEQEEDRYRTLEIESRQTETVLEGEKKSNLDKEVALSERQRELNRFVGQIRGMENDKKIVDQKMTFLEQNRKQLKERIEKAALRVGKLEEEIVDYRTNLQEEKRIEATLEDLLEEAEKKLERIKSDHSQVKGSRDQVLKNLQQTEQAVVELEKQKAIHQNQISNRQKEQERQAQEIADRTQQISTIKVEENTLAEELQELNGQLQHFEQQKVLRLQRIGQLSEQLEALRNQQTTLNRTLDAKRNEFQLTQSMVDNFEGFPESIKFLSNPQNWKTNAPLLSDLIYVKERYRVPIENYLDAFLNYYVVMDLEEAFKAIRLLSNAQKGKANFFLLDEFKDYTPPMMAQVNGLPAIDLVETDPKYYNLFSALLERVVIVEQDEQILNIPVEAFIVLSQSGRLIRKKYSLSGGSIGLFEGKKIGRKKNLEVLELEINQLERQLDRLASDYYNTKDQLESVQAQSEDKDIVVCNQRINQVNQQKAVLNSKLESFEGFLSNLQSKMYETQQAIIDLENKTNEIEATLYDQQTKAKTIKDSIQQSDDTFQSVAERLTLASAKYNEHNINYLKQQNKVNTLQQELSFREKQFQENQAEWHQNQKSLTQAAAELSGLNDEIVTMTETLQTSYKKKDEWSKSLTAFEQAYFKSREYINELEKKLRQQTKAQQDTQLLINQLKDKFNDVKQEISAITQRLRIEFNLNIHELSSTQPIPKELDSQELQDKIDRIKGQLENYGEINPLAVEAYDTMKQRYDSIAQQRDDILKAQTDLEATIKEIETTATNQFLKAFEETRVYFIEAFRSLFTAEDTCDLILLHPDDPLNSAIEIIAKPKGKRPQSISQLSGGEKTLTATALLFSFYLLKPAPFCIFDEVDAPLDDANIEKFNNIIKKFSKDSQFIIVTHNKMTMSAVDVIYGVYMQEQGVSNVSPVDFRSLMHQPILEIVQEA